MYPPWSQDGRAMTRAGHEGSAHDLGDRSQQQKALRPPPMEPRPSLHTSLTESTGRLGLQEILPYHEHPQHDNQARGQKLPALRDVLSQDYSSLSTVGGAPHPTDRSSVPYGSKNSSFQLAGYHPPMKLPSTPLRDQRQDQSNWLESQSLLGMPSVSESRQFQSIPLTTHPTYTESQHRFLDNPTERASEQGIAPQSNGIGLIHNEQPAPEEQSARQASRASRHSQQSSGTDNHGKYLRVEEVPGEGEFYIYEDGHRIPTSVDGEQVNPNWGLTKAMKPRKRLAMACLDCREKKIKCEPGVKSCMQCEKAMRPCRKAADKFSQPDTPANVMYVAGSPVQSAPLAMEEDRASSRAPDSEYVHKRRIRADPSPPLEPSKKHRDHSPPRMMDAGEARLRNTMRAPYEAPHLSEPSLVELSWEVDPYAVAPEMTQHLLAIYFAYINTAAYAIFPERHFLKWLKEYDKKCQNERMLLYAMIAAASVFAGNRFTGFGKQCFHVAGEALATQIGKFNIATATSKLLLAFYHHARGAEATEWDYIGSAIRAVTVLDLNTESGCLNDAQSRSQQRFEFAFTSEQLAECKRRVLWCTFLQDRFCDPAVCSLKADDIFVRVPCSERSYEDGLPSNAPRFANGMIEPDATGPISAHRVSSVAWLVPICAIFGDVADYIFRATHRAGSTYRSQYDAFRAATDIRLKEWHRSLPEHWHYSTDNLARSMQKGYSHTFVLTHVLHHYALVKLNRFVRHKYLRDIVKDNIRATNHHAHQVLTIVNETQNMSHAQQDAERAAIVFTSPIIVMAIYAAIDVVSAGGPESRFKYTMDKMEQALSILADLEQYWNIAKDKKRQCQVRHLQLKNVSEKPKTSKTGCWMGRRWGVKEPMEEEFSLQNDCIYGLGAKDGDEESQKYFEAFDEERVVQVQ